MRLWLVPLNGSVDVTVGPDGEVQSAPLTIMSVRNGFLRVSGYGSTIRVPSVDMVLRQQGSETVLQNLFVDLDQLGEFTLNAVRRKSEQIFTSELKLEADFLDAELFPAFMAKTIGAQNHVVDAPSYLWRGFWQKPLKPQLFRTR